MEQQLKEYYFSLKNEKTVVEGSVGWCMANKNLKFDSYIVKWWGVGDL